MHSLTNCIVYAMLWYFRNGLDFIFISMFIVYLPLRIIGLRADQETAAIEALSILSKSSRASDLLNQMLIDSVPYCIC